MKKYIALALSLVMVFALCGNAFASSGGLVGTDTLAHAQAVALDIAEEGDVLVKNENNSLPLAEGAKVNVFGTSSVDPFYGGGGSGAVSVSGDADFYSALTKAGIQYNTQLHDAYANWYSQYAEDTAYAGTGGATGMTLSAAMNAEWDIMNDQYDTEGQLRRAKMDPAILEAAKEYSDTAIVFIARSGSEGADLEQSDLELREPEVAMLQFVTSNFENVIVIFNICNVMEMGWINGGAEYTYVDYTYGITQGSGCNAVTTNYTVPYDEPHNYTVGECDSALIIWAPGESGMEAVGEILAGKVNPSGKLADTIAYDIDTNPTTVNFGSTPFADSTAPMNVYEEGIYVGYLYYETFAPEAVQFPFGYGLSYTSFQWSDFAQTAGTNEYGEVTITLSAKVTNTGTKAGKDVVELYYTQPYYNNSEYGIEKALVNLGGFTKTSLLAPEASETVSVTLNVRDMASWSSKAVGYVLEAGNYSIVLASDANKAHTAPAYTYTYNVAETTVYTTDEATGTEYTVFFDDAEGIGEVTNAYMHRIDVDGVPTVAEGTYPQAPDGTEHIDFAARAEKYGTYYYKDYATLAAPDFSDAPRTELADAQETGVVYDEGAYMLQQVYYDLQAEGADEEAIWDKWLDQFTIYDMIYVNGRGGYQTAGMGQFGLPEIADQDGPAAIKYSSNVYGNNPPEGIVNGEGCAYPVATAVCCTWNIDLARAWGDSVADEGIALGTYGWYAPALNNHRSPMSGRNFEYFSEDSYLGGTMCGNVIEACEAKGVVCYLKHFAMNDQETDRLGICTFANEQAIREVYLEAFEIAVKASDCSGIMSSFNRIGLMWSGSNFDLLNGVLRGEWGFEGGIVTDYYLGGYMNAVLAAFGGNDLLLSPGYSLINSRNNSVNANAQAILDYYAVDPVGMTNALRSCVKNIALKAFATGVFAKTLEEGYVFPVTDNTWRSTINVGSDTVDYTAEEPDLVAEFPVSISGNEGLTAMHFEATGIDFTGAVVDVNFGDVEFNSLGETLKIVWWKEDGPLTDDLLFTISLDLSEREPLAAGEYPITLTPTDVVDRMTNSTSVIVNNGTLTVIAAPEYAKGDVDLDGDVDNADLVMLARYLVHLETFNEKQMEIGDYDNDGDVDNGDLVLLARHLVGLEQIDNPGSLD